MVYRLLSGLMQLGIGVFVKILRTTTALLLTSKDTKDIPKVKECPPKPMRDKLSKMGSRGVPGLFMGYHMHPGGRWSGDYWVSPLADWDATKTSGSKVRFFRVKELVFDSCNIVFPMRPVADTQNRQITKPKSHLAVFEVDADSEEKASGEGIGIRSKPERAPKVEVESLVDGGDSEESPDFVGPEVVHTDVGQQADASKEAEVSTDIQSPAVVK